MIKTTKFHFYYLENLIFKIKRFGCEFKPCECDGYRYTINYTDSENISKTIAFLAKSLNFK